MADAIAFEKRGIPAAPIITDKFINLSKNVAKGRGSENLPVIVISHPTRDLKKEQVEEVAENIAESVATILTCEECLIE